MKKLSPLTLIALVISILLLLALFVLCLWVHIDEGDGETNAGRAFFLVFLMVIFHPAVCGANAILAGLSPRALFPVPIVTSLAFIPLALLLGGGSLIDGAWNYILPCVLYLLGSAVLFGLTALCKHLLLRRRRRKKQKNDN